MDRENDDSAPGAPRTDGARKGPVDHDMVVTQAGQRTGSIDQNAQFGLCGVDPINAGTRRDFRDFAPRSAGCALGRGLGAPHEASMMATTAMVTPLNTCSAPSSCYT